MKRKKKSLQQLYNERKALPKSPTPGEMFILEVAEVTHKSPTTVRMWLGGRQTPDELTQSIIADKYNVDINGLFPETQKRASL